MLKLNDNCITSKQWLHDNFGVEVEKDLVSTKELDNLIKRQAYWDYAMSEINHLFDTASDLPKGEDYMIQLVQFEDCYRFCELADA